jgi:GNAT superfamily N-acetyltransferase
MFNFQRSIFQSEHSTIEKALYPRCDYKGAEHYAAIPNLRGASLILHFNSQIMDIYARQMSSDDAAAVTALSRQLGYPLPAEQILQNITLILSSNDHDAFVAIYDSEVVGWIGVAQAIMIESKPFCEINGLVIDENHRGKGVGKLLVERATLWAKQKGNDMLRLRCNVRRAEAHQFYLHLGFKEIKQQTTFSLDLTQ